MTSAPATGPRQEPPALRLHQAPPAGLGARVHAAITGGLRALVRQWAELALVASFLGGWAFLTWGVASLLVWQVWPMSIGILLLSFPGLRVVAKALMVGVYLIAKTDGDV